MKRMFGRTAVVLVAVVAMLVPATMAGAAGQSDLAALRQATERFHDVAVARSAGYQSLLSCFDSNTGGMGQHYVRVDQLDGHLDPLQPEAMVYQVRPNGYQLVAVEFIVPKDHWGPIAPTLYGQVFTPVDSLGLWVLHAWIWHPNPDGIFKNYNPSIPACPGS